MAVDLAKLTAEATGKELSQEASSTAPGSEATIKQEPVSPVPSTPERREGLRACYWEGPSELSLASARKQAERNTHVFVCVFERGGK